MTYFLGNDLFSEFPTCSTEECLDYLRTQKIVGLDIETSRKYPRGMYREDVYVPGLDPYVSRVIMLQIGTLEKRFVIDTRVIDPSFLKEILENKEILKVGHNCLPEHTEVLTTLGWKSIKNVTTQDKVFGYNNGNVEVQSVIGTVSKKDDLVVFQNSGRCFESTIDHRWLVKDRLGRICYKTTKEIIGTRDQIILNGKYNNTNFNTVSLTIPEIEVFTWLITDGSIRFGKKGKVGRGAITQSLVKPTNVELIKKSLQESNLSYREDVVKFPGYQDCIRFDIHVEGLQKLMEKISYSKDFNYCEFVLSLNPQQLDTYLNIFNLAEGCESCTKTYNIGQSYVKNPKKRDSIALALYLKGFTVSFNSDSVFGKKRINADCRTLKITEEKKKQDVFCLEVPFSNFVVRQRECIFLTGNCKFEGKFLLVHYNINIYNVWDTMIAEKVLFNGLRISYALEALMKRYLGYTSFKENDLFDTPEEDVEEDEVLDDLDMLDYKEKPLVINKATRLQFINIGDAPFTVEQILYGDTDITAPLKIYEIQRQGRMVQGELYLPHKGFYLENKTTQVLANIEVTGLNVDPIQWKQLAEKSKQVFISRKEKLDQYIETILTNTKFCDSGNLFNPNPACRIQWTSSKQVIELFKHWGICPKERSKQTGRDEYTVGAKALFGLLDAKHRDYFQNDVEIEIKDVSSFIVTYLLMKKAEQASTTFGEDWLKYIHPITFKVHTNFNQYMNTSRLSSNNPNIQNIPSGAEYRKCFVSPENTTWINADFESQELRIAAEVTKVPFLVTFFRDGHEFFGRDFHSFSATQMFRVMRNNPDLVITKETGKKERTISKSITFKLNYGGSAFTVAKDLGVDEETGENFVNAYFDGFPGLRENFEETKKLAMKRGWIELDPYTGKRYFFPDFDKMQTLSERAWSYYPEDYRKMSKDAREEVKAELKITAPELSGIWKEFMLLKGKLERRSLNFKIQGFAASMGKLAAILIYNTFIDNELRKMICLVHDEIIGQTSPEDAPEYAKIIGDSMVKAGELMCKLVPMGADVEIANFWKH